MAAIFKKPFKKFNGVDHDKYYLETSEDQLKEGWVQGTAGYGGYRKLPGGLILQWGAVATGDFSYYGGINGYTGRITFPVAYTANPKIFTTSAFNAGIFDSGVYDIDIYGSTLTSAIQAGGATVLWFSIGF